jgi:hypothetical protein
MQTEVSFKVSEPVGFTEVSSYPVTVRHIDVRGSKLLNLYSAIIPIAPTKDYTEIEGDTLLLFKL